MSQHLIQELKGFMAEDEELFLPSEGENALGSFCEYHYAKRKGMHMLCVVFLVCLFPPSVCENRKCLENNKTDQYYDDMAHF